MVNKKILVFVLAVTAFAGSFGIIGVSHAAPLVPPVVVTDAYWYGQNSTELVSPGSNFTPLFVQFDVVGSYSYVNASVNLSYYTGSPFTYSYISGPDANVRSYYNLSTFTQPVTITQLVDVSSSAAQGVYEIALEVTTNATPNTPYFATFQVAVLGTPQVNLVNYYTNPPALYQDEKYIQLTAVVSNTGAGPAKNLQVSASSADFQILTGTYNIAYMPSGTVQNFTFLMNAANVTGQAPVALYIGNSTHVLPLYLNSYGYLKITSAIPTLTSGANTLLEQFNITNTGNKTMLDVNVHLLSPSVVSIHIPSSNPLSALTADNFTIAELFPGQTVIVTYIVDVSSSASAQSYPAQIYVQWHLNDTSQQFYQTYNFNETVSPTALQQFTSNFTFTPLNIGILLLIIVLIAALIGVSARSRRIRKKLQKAEEKKETPSLIHREIPEKNGNERKN